MEREEKGETKDKKNSSRREAGANERTNSTGEGREEKRKTRLCTGERGLSRRKRREGGGEGRAVGK